MTISNILSINSLQDKLRSQSLPFALAYKFTKLFKSISTDLEFYSSSVQKLIDMYAARDEVGNPIYLENGNIKIEDSHLDECESKISELLNTPVDNPPVVFTVEELEPVSFTIDELYPLMELIIE